MKIRTEALNFVADVNLLTFIENRVSKLENFFHRISETRVVLKLEQVGVKKERIAEIKVHVPNGIIFIKESSKSFESALNKALIVLKLELLRYKAKRLSYGLL